MFKTGHKDKLMEEVMQNEDFSELSGENTISYSMILKLFIAFKP